jgi:GeoRSP system SPASM domain protein
MTELLAPVVVQWHVGTDRAMNDQTANALVRNRVLMVYLRGGNGVSPDHLTELCKVLTSGGVRVILTIPESLLSRDGHLFEGIRVYVEPDDPEAPVRYGQTGITGIAISVSEPVVPRLPGILRQLHRLGYRSVYFPLPRPGERLPELVKLPDPDTLKRVSHEMKLLTEDMEITVHDPMLDRLVFGRKTHGGCSAGDTTLFIQDDCTVSPCPLIPVRFGNLRDTSLEEVFRSEERASMVRKLRAVPEECRTCEDAENCRGGCRGRAFLLRGDLQSPDPACPALL